MSGTDHSKSTEEQPGPVMVLVRPQMGENIGAAARAMWNFGLRRMRIVDPRDGWPSAPAVAMASGAGLVLDDALIHETTGQAVADSQIVYATTARARGMTKRVLSPEQAMAEARGYIANGARVSVLFGPERSGLENEDVVLADAIISVPVNPVFASLNLAQCVLLTAYEWRRAGEVTQPDLPERADVATVTRLLEHLVNELDETGFFFPAAKRPVMIETLENLFRRMPMTDQDVRTLWGVARALASGPNRRR